MSRELEMLRAALDSSGTCSVLVKTDLRAILRRMEDAERVCEKATRWWDTATVAHDAGVEYRVKGDAESRLRAVAADAAHADTIVGLGEAIEAYRATKEPRDDE